MKSNDDLRAALALAKMFNGLNRLAEATADAQFSELAARGYDALDKIVSYDAAEVNASRRKLEKIFRTLDLRGQRPAEAGSHDFGVNAACRMVAASGRETLKKI